ALQLPLDDLIGQLPAAVPRAQRRLGDLRIPEKLAVEFALRDLVVVPFLDLVNREQTLRGLGIFGDDAFIRLRTRPLGALAAAAPAKSTAASGGVLLRRIVLRAEHTGRQHGQ